MAAHVRPGLLLPHGFEGQGPEHSSARLERYLQLYAKDNMQVVNSSTPASYFHALRRQLHRQFRKPLIVMTPKSLLRHKLCVSSLEEMGPGSSFHRVMCEQPPIPGRPRRDPRGAVQRQGLLRPGCAPAGARLDQVVALLRLEQLAPFPDEILAEELVRYPKRAPIVWCQEEPRNMGAWSFVAPRDRGGPGAGRDAPPTPDLRRSAAGRLARDRPVPGARARAEQPGRDARSPAVRPRLPAPPRRKRGRIRR